MGTGDKLRENAENWTYGVEKKNGEGKVTVKKVTFTINN